ncbi:DEAD/DEAH box helicase [Pantoea sp. B270]|uniref:DEAD/DEAH box helicase n=1 Tax=Pantoea sp. B270 TaxID=2836826 RepID=UPI001BFF63B4|nr:DEAD/DEAH box helicase [Pantoea sp. B270]MBU6520819.1 DEAD/DEAH box helicase [Pantoea sp. B270]
MEESIEIIYEKLIKQSISKYLNISQTEKLDGKTILKLLSYSSLLALSDEDNDVKRAYDIISRVLDIEDSHDEKIISACDIILSRIGNFPGRDLLRKKYNNGVMPRLNIPLSLERIGRESENTHDDIMLTNFQYKLLRSMIESNYLSVSAPTSAGKSFVLALAIINKIKLHAKECIVYVVPTRALITEVSLKIRNECISAGLNEVIVRTIPEPVEIENIAQGLIYVLTQERVISLLSASYNSKNFFINSLFIDEAHEIQKGKRGIVLQNSIELALEQHPHMQVMFSSPLISNPEYFFSIFRWRRNGESFVETVSPVTQNLILINEKKNHPRQIWANLINLENKVELGVIPIDFELRGKKTLQKALFAKMISKSGGAVIIFDNNPSTAEETASLIPKISESKALSNDYLEFIALVAEEMHEDYILIECLKNRSAFHYGNMPSIIRNGIEYFFKLGEINFLVCTSTLLQGVNLPAKHLIIENPHSGEQPMTRSDFLNLAGRAGRLKYEFQGNVWCIRSDNWDEKSFQGQGLHEIKSSMSKIMEDGGSLITNAIDNLYGEKDNIELAEVAFARFYQEVKRDGYQLSYFNSDFVDGAHEILEYNYEKVSSMKITVPEELIKINSGTRPDCIQRLYDYFKNHESLDDLILTAPYQKGGKARVDKAIDIIMDIFKWPVSQGYAKLISTIAHQWMTSKSLKSMINYKINKYKLLNGILHDGLNNPKGKKKISTLIREVLNTLENQVRYNLVRYLKVYREVLIHVLIEAGMKDKAEKVENISAYLEFGSCNSIELNLMSLGISRSTAIALRRKFKIPKSFSPEQTLEYLREKDFNSYDLPNFQIRELNLLVDKKSA